MPENNIVKTDKSSESAKVTLPPKNPVLEKMDFSQKVKTLFHGKFLDNFHKVNKTEKVTKVTEKKPGYEGQQTEKLYEISDFTKDMTPKKIAKLVGIVIGALLIVSALYLRYIRKEPVRQVPVMVNLPTPSYTPYQKYKPSIYAEDTNFKKIDEGIGVLENEVNNVTLEDKSILLPALDFDITFK